MNNEDFEKRNEYKPPFFTEQKTMRLPSAPKQHRARWILLGILIVIIVAGAGVYAGYASAIQERIDARNGYRALEAVKQFQLAAEDQTAGRYSVAVKRLEYIISVDADFPGAQEKLQEILLQAAMTGQVIEVSSAATGEDVAPTVEPTRDTRAAEQIFANAQQLMAAGDWGGAMAALDNVRSADIQYRAVDVDGMYYVALRYQGIEKISQGNLEGGIYNMTLASRFGPLDREADNYRSWARQYLTGVAFWEVDWAQVVSYFSNIIASLPNLRDGSGVTAAERYRIANMRYADDLIWNGDYCGAEPYVLTGLSLSNDEYTVATATQLALYCRPPEPTATPEPTKDESVPAAQPTATTDPGSGGASPTDTPEPTETTATDPDTDGDGVPDSSDICPDDPDPAHQDPADCVAP